MGLVMEMEMENKTETERPPLLRWKTQAYSLPVCSLGFCSCLSASASDSMRRPCSRSVQRRMRRRRRSPTATAIATAIARPGPRGVAPVSTALWRWRAAWTAAVGPENGSSDSGSRSRELELVVAPVVPSFQPPHPPQARQHRSQDQLSHTADPLPVLDLHLHRHPVPDPSAPAASAPTPHQRAHGLESRGLGLPDDVLVPRRCGSGSGVLGAAWRGVGQGRRQRRFGSSCGGCRSHGLGLGLGLR